MSPLVTTVSVNCAVPPIATVALVGKTETEVIVGLVVDPEVDPPPQVASSKTAKPTRQTLGKLWLSPRDGLEYLRRTGPSQAEAIFESRG
jgi:hypothetical protein